MEEAQSFATRLAAEGIPNGTISNNGFADRHIYTNWTYVLEKRGVTAHDNPWTCASYKGNVQYSRDMCPNTLNWLGRAVAISLHQRMTDEDVTDVVRAVRKVAGVQ